MDVTIIKGKKEKSEHFFIRDLNQIYTKHAKLNDSQFVKCYYSEKGCKARGKIDASGFRASDGQYALHSHYEYTTSSTLNYLAFFNEMKDEARKSGKLPNIIYGEVMSRYDGMFDQLLTFPNVQSTLLRCRKKYFPRFPQTAEQFYKAFEEHSMNERYGHCFETLFYHGVLGNEITGRSAVFYTDKLLQYFNSVKHEIKAFADATFKYQPTYFHQLFIVHFAIGNYALLRRMKTTKGMTVDFNLLRILSSLAFLPPDHIVPTLKKVKAKYCKALNRQFFKYFDRFWIKNIGPEGFSIYGRDHITNNVAESFHSLIKNFFGVLANATASSKVWELLDQINKIHHKMEIQIHTYSQKQFMGLIRTKSKKKSLICKNRLNALYSRMRDDKVSIDGLNLVESIYDSKFVEYVEELENERLCNQDDFDDDDVSSEGENDSISVDSDPKCAVYAILQIIFMTNVLT